MFKLKSCIIALGLSVFLGSTGAFAAVTVVADIGTDYTSKFQFYWNAPTGWVAGNPGTQGTLTTGAITDLSSHRALVLASGNYYSADGNTAGTDSLPASYLSINKGTNQISGHPGRGTTQQGAGSFDRAVITTFTVTTAGYYSILDSFLTATNTDASNQGNGLQAIIFTYDASANQVTEVNTVNVAKQSTGNFNTDLSWLDVNDRIFVAYSPNTADGWDGFSSNYKIGYDTVPEPGRSVLLLLGGGFALMWRRRQRQ